MHEPMISSEEKFEEASEQSHSKIAEQCIRTNWIVAQENKQLSDAISIVESSKALHRLTLDEISTEDSCVILQPANVNIDSDKEACVIDINLTGQKISRIGVVSEASVIEFFKESGEYAGTEFAELIDEYEGATVYLAQLTFRRPTPQASIKFTRIHNSRSNMYLYGMRLVIENDENSEWNQRQTFEDMLKNSDSENFAIDEKNSSINGYDTKNMPNYDGNFSMDINTCLKSFMENTWMGRGEKSKKKEDRLIPILEPKDEGNFDEMRQNLQRNLESHLDKKFADMERRLMKRIDEVEERTTEKLDLIIKHLQLMGNTS